MTDLAATGTAVEKTNSAARQAHTARTGSTRSLTGSALCIFTALTEAGEHEDGAAPGRGVVTGR